MSVSATLYILDTDMNLQGAPDPVADASSKDLVEKEKLIQSVAPP